MVIYIKRDIFYHIGNAEAFQFESIDQDRRIFAIDFPRKDRLDRSLLAYDRRVERRFELELARDLHSASLLLKLLRQAGKWRFSFSFNNDDFPPTQ